MAGGPDRDEGFRIECANIAIDTTAGERERQSLEPLLLNAVSRVHLLIGKWLATSVFAIGVLTIAVVGFVLTMQFINTDEIGLEVSFELSQALQTFAVLVPLAILSSR